VGQPVGARPGWLSSRLGASHGAVAAAVAAGVGAASCHQEEERVAGAQGRRQRQRASGWLVVADGAALWAAKWLLAWLLFTAGSKSHSASPVPLPACRLVPAALRHDQLTVEAASAISFHG
jgi:hypothetical protein